MAVVAVLENDDDDDDDWEGGAARSGEVPPGRLGGFTVRSGFGFGFAGGRGGEIVTLLALSSVPVKGLSFSMMLAFRPWCACCWCGCWRFGGGLKSLSDGGRTMLGGL